MVERGIAFVLGQPDDLKRAVSGERTGLVIVDPLARPREQAGRGIVVIHDEVGVSFIALEGDADDHLTQRGAGQRVGSAEGLRAEDDVDAERAALSNDPVQQQRGFLRHRIVLGEKLLELVDEKQAARQRLMPSRALVTGEILRASMAE